MSRARTTAVNPVDSVVTDDLVAAGNPVGADDSVVIDNSVVSDDLVAAGNPVGAAVADGPAGRAGGPRRTARSATRSGTREVVLGTGPSVS
jgi:hypothetical protein